MRIALLRLSCSYYYQYYQYSIDSWAYTDKSQLKWPSSIYLTELHINIYKTVMWRRGEEGFLFCRQLENETKDNIFNRIKALSYWTDIEVELSKISLVPLSLSVVPHFCSTSFACSPPPLLSSATEKLNWP